MILLCQGGTMEIILKTRIRELRKGQCETQVQVANALGIAESQYQNYERGTNLPGVEYLWKLADHFNVSIDYLVGRSDER